MSKKHAALAITIILAVAALITIAKALFPVFAILAAIFLGLLVLSAFDYLDSEIPLIGLGVCLLLTGVSYFIGYGFGDSDVGKATTAIANAINTAQQVEDNVTSSLINVGQNTSITILRSSNVSDENNIERIVNASYDIIRIKQQLD